MNVGYIYKITNLVNGKVYIGQTSKTIEERFRHHKVDSNRKNKESYNYPLYRAFRKYGIDNFKVEEIEQCEIDNINEREIYWIEFYNSFNKEKGYNQTLGGDGKRTLQIDEQDIIDKYEENKNIFYTAKFFNCSSYSIRLVLLKNNIEIVSAVEHAKENGTNINKIDINSGEILHTYKSLHDAGQWVLENNLSNAKSNKNCAIAIRYAIIKDSYAYGFKWSCDEDTLTKLKNSLSNTKYLSKKSKSKKSNKNKICPICGNNMDNYSSICIKCTNNKKKLDSLIELEKKIPKETLMQLVREKSFNEIAKSYNVSDNTIKKWCKRYLIPFRKEDINNISLEDWNKECNLTKEEYKSKYCQPKEKKIYSDEKIIQLYKELGSLKAVVNECHKDRKTIKNVLIKNGITLDNFNQKPVTIQRLDKNTLEVLETYTYIKDVISWIRENTDTKAKEDSLRASLRKSLNNNSNFLGYKWKKVKD